MEIIFAFILSFSAFGDDVVPVTTCRDFKTGKYVLIDDKINGKYLIERNDTLQIEKDMNTGNTSKYRVTWVSDCEYHLAIIDGPEDIMNFFRGKILTIRIVETYRDSYKFEGQLEGYDRISTQIVRRVK
jgi:hypothetical protein